MTDWSKKTWFITGCSTGFGRMIAEAVVARGGRVVASARDTSSLADLVAKSDGRVITPRVDVTRPDEIRNAVREAEAAFGGIDVLVNNAGYGFIGGIEESSDQEIHDQFDVNFFGLAAMTRAVLPGMRARRSGFIVNISSIVGLCGMPSSGWYSASKFALEGLSESLAEEMRPFGIGVMIVEPGPFRTDFSGRSIRFPANPIADYQNAAETRAYATANDGKQPGDPVRGAEAIVDALNHPEPPLRLLLGKMASDMAEAIHTKRVDEVRRWRDVAVSTDYPE